MHVVACLEPCLRPPEGGLCTQAVAWSPALPLALVLCSCLGLLNQLQAWLDACIVWDCGWDEVHCQKPPVPALGGCTLWVRAPLCWGYPWLC